MLGDGVHAVFDDPRDAVRAAVEIAAGGSPTRRRPTALHCAVRCGLHAGLEEQPRQRFFRPRREPRGAHHGASRTAGRFSVSQTIATLVGDRLPTEVALRDLGSIRLRDLANAERVYQVLHPAIARGLPGAAHARGDAEQPAAAADVVHRPRAGAGRSRGSCSQKHRLLTLHGRGRHRQDPAVAAGRRRCDGRLSGRRLAGRARGARRSATRAAGGRVGARRQGGGRPPRDRGAGQIRRGPAVARDPRQLRAPSCRPARQLAKALLAGGPELRILATSREPLHVRGERSTRCRRWRFPIRTYRSSATRSSSSPPRGCSSSAPSRRSPRSSVSERERDGGRRHLPATRRHPARARARRGARAGAFRRADRGAPLRPLPAAHGRRPHGAAAPADAAGTDRLELRPPRRAGAHSVPPPGRLRRRLHARGGGSGGCRRARCGTCCRR